jgi:hypothetical protein
MITIDLIPKGTKTDGLFRSVRSGGRGITRDSDPDPTLSTDPLFEGVPSWTYYVRVEP